MAVFTTSTVASGMTPPVWSTTSTISVAVLGDCAASGMNAVELCDALHERGVWAQDTALHSVRMVTHWNVSRAGIDRAVQELKAVVQKKKGQVA